MIVQPRTGRRAAAACLLAALGFFACQGPTRSSGLSPDGDSAANADPGADKGRGKSGQAAPAEAPRAGLPAAAPASPDPRPGGVVAPSAAGDEASTPAPVSAKPLPRDPSAAPGDTTKPDAPREPRTGSTETAPAAGRSIFKSKEGDWPMWGGRPSRNIVNDVEKGIAASWDLKTKKNIKWMANLGSQAYGNPVIAEGKIFVGTNNQAERNPKIPGDKGVVMCFEESTGKFLWQAVHDKLEAGRVNDWPEQGICSSPCVEDGKVFYVSNRAEVICADINGFLDGKNDGPFVDEKYKPGPGEKPEASVDGDFIWVYDMMEELGVFPHNLATSSPLIVGDLVYVITSNGVEKDHITIPAPRAPSFIALKKATGELVWESNAPGEKILHGQWSSPSYIEAGGRQQIVFAAGDGWVRGLDPLKGEIIWAFDCNPKDAVYELGGKGTRNYIVATPVCVDGHVYIAQGQDPEHGEGIGHLYSIDASKEGDVTQSGKTWHYGDKDFRRTIASCAVKDGLVYAADLSGYLHCLDQKTGKPYWVHDMLAAVWGSPSWIDGKVYLGDEDGDVTVFKAGKTLEVLFETNMENSVYTTPVAAHGVLYIVNRTHLFAIAEAK